MTRIACGVDITSVARIEQTWKTAGPTFVDEVWSATELADCSGDAAMLAKRWAAKEATAKALGLGVDTLRPKDVVVRQTATGAPVLELSASAQAQADKLGVSSLSVSMSQEGDMAVAFVTVLMS